MRRKDRRPPKAAHQPGGNRGALRPLVPIHDRQEDFMSETEELARLALGGRAVRRRRLNRALLARLIGDRYESEDEDIEGEEGEGGEEEGRRIARLLIGSRLLRRR